ncbi:MAG: SDR family oxidoreductase [Chloroflexi bacterium]|nr:SDR family oxidoreductase [Chloroflexota bacterium]
MKVTIFGATGGTGAELVKQALEGGHTVAAFVRNPGTLAEQDRLQIVTGDIHNPADVEQAVQGQEAVICALGARDLKKTMIRTEGTRSIISAMKKGGGRRLIVVSAMGVGESWDSLSLVNKAFFAILLKSTREDHEAQEAAVKASGLDWTIIRPSGLVNTPRTGVYNVGENIRAKTSQIPRADVADLILNELEKRALIGKAVTITN